jgi:hypothetical protein
MKETSILQSGALFVTLALNNDCLPMGHRTIKTVTFNTKIVTVALIAGLAVVTAVIAFVKFTVFGQGVLKNEPDISTILVIVAAALWVVLTILGYFAPGLIFAAKERRLLTENQHSISLPAGGDVEALERSIDALEVETRAELLSC